MTHFTGPSSSTKVAPSPSKMPHRLEEEEEEEEEEEDDEDEGCADAKKLRAATANIKEEKCIERIIDRIIELRGAMLSKNSCRSSF